LFNYLDPSVTEIDGPEILGGTTVGVPTPVQNVLNYTTWKNGVRSGFQTVNAGSDLTQAVHKYRFEWGLDSVRFFYDDVLVASQTASIPTQPAYIILNLWVGSSTWGGVITPNTTQYEYVTSV